MVMNSPILAAASLAGALLLCAGCTFPSSGPMVPANQANQLQSTENGTVVKVREVMVEGRRTHLGQYGGAVVGGAAAVPNGGVGGKGEALAVAAASVAGAVVGEATEEYLTRKIAEELTVQLKDGTLVTIVQDSPKGFRPGDAVHVIHSPAGARVAMAQEF
jgi:outer membrane lipoprotein SlyB